MTFAVILACSIAACFVLRNAIHKMPMAFYALAVAVDVAFIAGVVFGMPRSVWLVFFTLVQKCTLSLALFVVVMYIGAFHKESKVSRWLRPIRAELSIIAWILSLGHMAVYLGVYVPRMMAGGVVASNLLLSFVVALILFVLLMVLGITSFNVIKKHMTAELWRKVQRLSYLFFFLVYVHLLIILMPSAMRGAQTAVISVALYSVLFGLYAVLRVARACKDRRAADTMK